MKPIKYPDCDICKGSGLTMGGDEYQQCSSCRLRYAADLRKQEQARFERRYGRTNQGERE